MSRSTTRCRERDVALCGVVLAFACLFGGWYDPATTSRLSAWQIGLGSGIESIGSYPLFSFGTAGLVLCLFTACAAWYSDRSMLMVGACGLIFLGLDCFLQIAVVHPEWIEKAKEGARDFQNTLYFANHYSVPDSYGSTPDGAVLATDGVIPDRLSDSYYCLNYGWCWYMFGSLLALLAAQCYPRHLGPCLCPLRLWAVIGLIILGAQLLDPLVGEYCLWNGDRAAAQDKLESAENSYRQAIRADGWYRVRPDLYLRIGALRQSHGDDRSPEARFFIGEETIQRNSYPLGMYWLKLALASNDHDFTLQVKNEIARLSLEQGKIDYSRGSQGQAIEEWQQSVMARPEQVAPYYMLGKANLDVSNPDEARAWFLRAQRQTDLPVIRSICWSAIGDTYYKNGELADARLCYLNSRKTDDQMNYRALKSLVDDYFR